MCVCVCLCVFVCGRGCLSRRQCLIHPLDRCRRWTRSIWIDDELESLDWLSLAPLVRDVDMIPVDKSLGSFDQPLHDLRTTPAVSRAWLLSIERRRSNVSVQGRPKDGRAAVGSLHTQTRTYLRPYTVTWFARARERGRRARTRPTEIPISRRAKPRRISISRGHSDDNTRVNEGMGPLVRWTADSLRLLARSEGRQHWQPELDGRRPSVSQSSHNRLTIVSQSSHDRLTIVSPPWH